MIAPPLGSDRPRYFDLQVNGFAGVDFNADDLDVDQLEQVCLRLRAEGVDRILATVITDTPAAMSRRLGSLAAACDTNPTVASVIHGFHIEGPFLNPADSTIGAHPKNLVQPADRRVMRRLLDAAEGRTRLVTLAPEIEKGNDLCRFLVDQGVVVSAGHCDPSLDQLKAAIDSGLSMFTHVGNACSLQLDRHDNIVQRVLSLSNQLWCCFVADGIHVPAFALANYLQAAGMDRSIVVSDAMAAAGLGPGNYRLGSIPVEVDDQGRAKLADGDGRLAGSVATMSSMHTVLTEEVGVSAEDAEKLLVKNPRTAIGCTAS